MARFGFQIPNFTYDVPDADLFEHVAGLAGAAESSGFSSVWVMDHFFQLPALGGFDQPMLEGYTLLGALAARTARVELGTLVTGVTYRNPALLAKIVTTLDVISGGRAVCGIGAAWYDVEHDALGFAFPSAGERLDRLEEAVQICRAMFTQGHATFSGRYFSITDARNLPRPVRAEGIPIMIGGSGERRTLRLVAQYADRCNLHGSPETIRHLLDVLQRHCADVDRDPAAIRVTWLGTLMLTSSPIETEEMRAIIGAGAGADLDERFVIGNDSEAAERIGEILEAGVDEVIVNMPFASADAIRRAGALLTGHFA
ncbi:MAG: LLM class F420-dependent oxidoreductase [Actinobacteria bacterium]|nr:LLM class F420-dependent oxidoreductase [Actinomycetota bacterium]